MADQEPRVEKIKLRDIVPNPFGDIPLNEEAVEQLATQFKSRAYHNHLIGRRRKDGKVEIAYGHHRTAGLQEAHGKEHEIEVEVCDLTDEDMIKELAGDNDFSFRLTPKKFDVVVRAARNYLQTHPEKLKETLSSEVQDDSRERVRIGAPAIAKFLHKKQLSHVQLALERVNAIDNGLDQDALYLMPNPHLMDIFVGTMKKYYSKLDKKYHVPAAKNIIQNRACTEGDMALCVRMAGRSLDNKELTYFDPDAGYNKQFKALSSTMGQLRLRLSYLPHHVNSLLSNPKKKIADTIRFKDLSTFRAYLIGLGKDLAYIRKYIESKVPADAWTQEEVEPTVKEYKARLERTEIVQGQNTVLHPGQLRKYFGLHKKADVKWERFYLWQVKKMIKQGKFYYESDKQEKPQVTAKAKQKKSRSRSSH